MAYFSLHAYDADVRIPFFSGLRQDSEIASDLRYALEAENVETPNGCLQPQAGYTIMERMGDLKDCQTKFDTIARFHRRWYEGEGSKDWLVCATGGRLYYRQEDDLRSWKLIEMPAGMTSFSSDKWSWVTYEKSYTVEVGQDTEVITIDILLISNAQDGMYMVLPPDRPQTWGDIKLYAWSEINTKTWDELYTSKWQIIKINTTFGGTEYKFGVIERRAERIWGTAITNEPDMLVYSTAYDPTDWRMYNPSDYDSPEATSPRLEEDCPGTILQPSWDGDSFKALKRFGDQLLAFKEHTVWRIMGVAPGEFQLVEQYGGGTTFPDTVAVDTERVLLVEKDGLSVYDGMTVQPFGRAFIEQFWKTVNRSAMDQMCAVLFKRKYYLSLPTGDSDSNNALIVYNIDDGTFLLYTDIYLEALMVAGEKLYATSATLPGKIMELHYNSWDTGVARGDPIKWATPWIDFNYKTIAKGGYEIYFNPEVKKYPVTFRFSIQTEKKTKTKMVTIKPTLDKAKQKRIRFGGTSRKFRLIIEVASLPTGAIWRLVGGIQMVVETDPD